MKDDCFRYIDSSTRVVFMYFVGDCNSCPRGTMENGEIFLIVGEEHGFFEGYLIILARGDFFSVDVELSFLPQG